MFENAMGFQQGKLCEDPRTARGVKLWLDRVLGFYGEKNAGVDVEIIAGQLILNARTADYIYGPKFTAPKLRYKKGSRPLLEQTLAEILKPRLRQRETALAILRRCRDNRDRGLKGADWVGGSEEELLKRGAIMCNEIHRVFVCLCQIAGLRARVMGAHISGHMMAEVEVDGCWWWVDAMKGWYCFKDDGGYASTWDLMRDPGLFARQPKGSQKDIRPVGPFREPSKAAARANVDQSYAKNRYCYFHPKEAICIGNYYVWEQAKYSFPWFKEPVDGDRLFLARVGEDHLRRELGWPDFYFSPYLLSEKMPARK
ncbi:MAG: transglutaminase domain-containing protein [Planctomycetota bacterium]